MLISSWNVNSVRARILNIVDYIKLSQPDILMIQEIKTEIKINNFATNLSLQKDLDVKYPLFLISNPLLDH